MATRTFRDLYPDRERWQNPAWFDLYADLSETEDNESGCCTAVDLYGCTRPSGHSGPHIADDGDDVLAVWEDHVETSVTNPTDTALLDWLASLPTDDGYSRWQFRRSSSGRGWRLLTTSKEPNYPTPREAVIAAYRECEQEIAALDQIVGDDK